MKLADLTTPTPDDARASLLRSHRIREAARRAESRRKALRRLFAVPALAGLGLLLWVVVSFDDPNLQALKIVVGLAFVMPWLSTFDVLGEARR